MRACAVHLEDPELLAILSAGDIVALEAKYHTKIVQERPRLKISWALIKREKYQELLLQSR